MALVYDNLKGMFKEDAMSSTPKGQKNRRGIMTKELSSLSDAGPEGHTLAYITPEEEKLLAKATGKETIMTAYGVPTYETDLTAEQMEENLKKADMYDEDELLKQAQDLASKNKDNSDLDTLHSEGKITKQEWDDKITQRSTDAINEYFNVLLKQRYNRLQEIEGMDIVKQTGKLIGPVITKSVEKIKSFFNKPKKVEDEVSREEFNPNKDYHLIKYLKEKQLEMQSKEPYFPPQP